MAQVLAQSKQFISTYLARSSTLLQTAEPEHTNGASSAAVAAQTQDQQSAEAPADISAAGGSERE